MVHSFSLPCGPFYCINTAPHFLGFLLVMVIRTVSSSVILAMLVCVTPMVLRHMRQSLLYLRGIAESWSMQCLTLPGDACLLKWLQPKKGTFFSHINKTVSQLVWYSMV